MECKFCGAKLEYNDSTGLYRCPNYKGFSSVSEVQDYLDRYDYEFEDTIAREYPGGWQTVYCDSSEYKGLYRVNSSGDIEVYDSELPHTERAKAFLKYCRRSVCSTCKYYTLVTPDYTKHMAMWTGCINMFMKEYNLGGRK